MVRRPRLKALFPNTILISYQKVMNFGLEEQQTLKYPDAMGCKITVHELFDTVEGSTKRNFNISRSCIDAMRIASTPFTLYDFSLGMCFGVFFRTL